jgi:hypothetical protein
MLKKVYTDIASICSDPYKFNLDSIYSIKKVNCTANYFKEIESQEMLDYDPLINGQDFGMEYLKTLAIKKDLKNDDIYYVTFLTPVYGRQKTIKLRIVKENDRYKIDYVFLDK